VDYRRVKSSTDQEKVGEEYFDELVLRMLIDRRSIGDEEVIFEMHSLINELPTMISSSYCTMLEEPNLHERYITYYTIEGYMTHLIHLINCM